MNERSACTPIANVTCLTHDEWLEHRRTGIGGSDASTIVGLNPYNSTFALYMDKIGALPPKDETEAMRIGHDLEQYVASRWMEATGKKCHRNNFMWRSKDWPWMLADIDREITGENAGLECKTTSAYNNHDFASGEIPLTYYVQCQHYMAVMGFDKMYLAVVQLGKGFYHFEIERNCSEIAALAEQERLFWECLQKGEAPEADGSDATKNALQTVYPRGSETDTAIMLERATEANLLRLDEINDAVKQLKTEGDAIKAEIMAQMGDNLTGYAGQYICTWKPQSRCVLDTKRLKAEHPEIYKEYSKTTETRVFKTKRKDV